MRILALGHLVLKVRNIDDAVDFYARVLSIPLVARAVIRGMPMAFFSIAGNHHDLALMQVNPDGPSNTEAATGLAHFALKVGNSLDELRAVRTHLQDHSVQIDRTVDHRVAQSLYIRDPDQHTIELYVDADPAIWRDDPAKVAHSEAFTL